MALQACVIRSTRWSGEMPTSSWLRFGWCRQFASRRRSLLHQSRSRAGPGDRPHMCAHWKRPEVSGRHLQTHLPRSLAPRNLRAAHGHRAMRDQRLSPGRGNSRRFALRGCAPPVWWRWHGLATYVAEKSAQGPHPDPVEDLRQGWDLHVTFGLTHPGLFAIMSNDPGAHGPSPAIIAGARLLRQRISAIARAGQLKISEDRAVTLLHSAFAWREARSQRMAGSANRRVMLAEAWA